MYKVSMLFLLLLLVALQNYALSQPNEEQLAGKLAREYFLGKRSGVQSPKQVLPPKNEIEAMQQQGIIGHTTTEGFGLSIASAGDVNADGYPDVIVGAPRYDSYRGRAYLYLGGMQLDNTADAVFTGEFQSDNFGWAVASAGDMNGDGYADILIGAHFYGGAEGTAYVYYGGNVVDQTPDLRMYGGTSNAYLGTSLACAGDVNGDGYSDVIIGANGAAANSGRAYIYYGGMFGNGVADVTLSGDNGFFGSTVAGVGDVNGDGFTDVAVGEHPFNSNTGGVYVFLGSANMDNTADISLMGIYSGSYYGKAIAAGDVNGDGFSDVVVGAYGYSSNTGYVNVFNGGVSMDANNDLTLWGEVSGGGFGAAVACSDINSDGYADILVGAYGVESTKGRVYGYWGGASPDNNADIRIEGEAAGNAFGSSLSAAGDLNNDGNEDFLVGAHFYGAGRGKLYIYRNSNTGFDMPDITFRENNRPYFGWAVSNTGDVNGDGFDDILVGAWTQGSAGRAYLYFGGPVMDNIADVAFIGDSSGFGSTLGGKGDVNGDGYSDVVIGDNSYDRNKGRAYFYLGGPSIDNVSEFVLTGDSVYRNFGWVIDKSGDVNGDGFNDLVIGAPGSDGSYSPYVYSQVYVYRGGVTISQTPAQIIGTWNQFKQFGYSINCSGDYNGDGIHDIAVGAYNANERDGLVTLFLGNNSHLDDNFRFSDDSTSYFGDLFGYALSSGDVNRDGYDDLVVGSVGAYDSDGRLSIYYGGANLDFVKDVNIRGGRRDGIGYQLDCRGDVNGDGYDDILTSAIEYGGESGRVIVYMGGSPPDTIPDVAMSSPGNALFGLSLAYVGDQNGDGMSDILVGKPDYIGLMNNEQAALLYLSSASTSAPRISSIKDVQNDQGGKVNLRWVRSGFDAIGSNKSVSYQIDRSPKPVNGIFAWENITAIAGDKNVYYNYTASLPSDSMSGNLSLYYFRVTARTGASGEFWRSNILSGYAVDNLAPATVVSLACTPSGLGNRLSWKLNSEPDMRQYLIYRSNSNSINTSTAEVYATTTDSVFTDNSPLLGESYYFVSAQDIHQNQSNPVGITSPNAAINLTLFLEGSYDAISDQQTPDSIRVYLCAASAPYNRIDSAVAVVNASGNASVKFFNAVNSTYYVVVTHRNSISTWSKAGGETISKGSTLNYDFSTEASSAYGSNLRQKGSRWCLYSGDVNQDGIVDFSDLTMIDNDAYQFGTGYLVTDLSGDSFVDFTDLAIADNNSYNYIQELRPGGMYKTGVGRGILRTKSLPKEFTVSDNYPNPFNPSTNINYSLPKDAMVDITLYSILGEKVAEILHAEQRAGYYTVNISMKQFASGTYILRISADEDSRILKLLLTK